jgi:hypothetical protein
MKLLKPTLIALALLAFGACTKTNTLIINVVRSSAPGDTIAVASVPIILYSAANPTNVQISSTSVAGETVFISGLLGYPAKGGLPTDTVMVNLAGAQTSNIRLILQ